MPRRVHHTLLLLVLTAALLVPVAASGPTFWTVGTTNEFLQGTSDGVYISLTGQITPGPALANRLTSTPAQVWSVLQAPDGTLWAGTGGDGRVVRLAPGATQEETVFDAPEANIFALAIDGSRLYAASSPDGKVYVIENDEPARVLFDPGETYIWALAVDGEGRLWVGAGSPAVLYRVAPDGTSEVVHRPQASHVVELAVDGEGRVLAGTEAPGRLYRYDDDRPFVLLDTDTVELSALVVTADDVIWAAGVAKGDESSSAGETTSVAVTMAATATAGGSSTAGSSSTGTTSPPRRSSLYRIDASGLWEEIWTTPDVIYDLALDGDDVIVATGPAGRMYRVTPDLDVYLFTGVDARQVTRFATGASGGVTAFATANPGRVMAVGSGRQSPATYISAVHDTGSVANWGLIRWNGTSGIELFTRSGNTARPDDSWSDWAGPYRAGSGEPIASPTARFIQWRAVFTSPAGSAIPALRSVTLAYLPRNSRPVVRTLTLHPPGVVFKRPFVNDESAIAGMDEATIEARRPPGAEPPAAPPLSERMFERGLQTITWRAEDADNDLLTYTVQYRRDGDATWRNLVDDLVGQVYVWDTTTVADGRYVVRVIASDRLSNPTDRALAGWRDSDIVEVDNTPPIIEVDEGDGTRLVLTVRDAASPVRSLEYAIAGGRWMPVYPEDGLADSPVERFVLTLPEGVSPGDVVVRATDRFLNSAARSLAP